MFEQRRGQFEGLFPATQTKGGRGCIRDDFDRTSDRFAPGRTRRVGRYVVHWLPPGARDFRVYNRTELQHVAKRKYVCLGWSIRGRVEPAVISAVSAMLPNFGSKFSTL